MKETVLLFVLVSSLALAAPSGWQSFTDKSGQCRYAVPANWKKDFGSFVTAPDKAAKASAVVQENDLKAIKQAVTSFKPKLFEDSSTRLAYRVAVGKTVEFYSAIARGSQLCIVRANADAPSRALEQTLQQIASSAAWK